MASPFPLRSTFAIVLLSATAVFGCTGGTDATASSELIVLRYEHEDPYDSYRPAPSISDFARERAAFEKAVRAPARLRFPLSLVAEPSDPAQPLAAMGPGRCSVTPGRAACDRQSVPSRSRRKVRVWERDASV